MSPKKLDCGKTFLEYQLPRPINFIYFDIRFWSPSESLNKNNGGAFLEFKDQSGNWTTAIDFFD